MRVKILATVSQVIELTGDIKTIEELTNDIKNLTNIYEAYSIEIIKEKVTPQKIYIDQNDKWLPFEI